MRIAALLATTALPILACECVRLTVCDLLNSPTLFVGEVIDGGISSIHQDPWITDPKFVRFRVIESFRGLAPGTKTVDVKLEPTFGMCAAIPYFAGRRYLVVPGHRDGDYIEGGCFASREVSAMSRELATVREYFAGKMPPNIQGTVAPSRFESDHDMVDFLLDQGETHPIAGARIVASRNGQIYSTYSDAEGRFRLNLRDGGVYQLLAMVSPFPPQLSQEVEVPDRGCTARNIALRVDNTISGHVWDAQGRPVEGARVGLIDLDHPAPEDHVWTYEAYTEKDTLEYEFEAVPPGHYLLVFNPDGPQAKAPFESTFYPGGSERARAEVVVVAGNGQHLKGRDLVQGKPVEFRKISAKVVFADGSRMNTAEVRVSAKPGESGIRWRRSGASGQKEMVQIEAPADRELTIEVLDFFDRDLGRPYVAIHAPGKTPITEQFVISDR